MVHNLIISLDEAKRIVQKDIPLGSATTIDRNIGQCYLACNTWLAMGVDLNVRADALMAFRDSLLAFGLVRNVKAAGDLAEGFLEETRNSSEVGSDSDAFFFKNFVTSRDPHYPLALIADYLCQSSCDATQYHRDALQFLLYLERFTYYNPDELAEVYSKFFGVNERCREYYYTWPYARITETSDGFPPELVWPGDSVLKLVSEFLAEVFRADAWDFDPTDRSFSAGANDSVGRDFTAKWTEVTKYYPYYKGLRDCPLPVSDTFHALPENRPGLLAVPKTLVQKRIIAPESVLSSWNASAVLEALRRMNSRTGASLYINEEDQSRNTRLASEGSVTGEWATIDMSSASDSISKALFFRCLPPEFTDVYLTLAPSWVKYKVAGEVREKKLFTLLTSGNRVTWLTEAMWFLAIARAGTFLCGYEDPSPYCFAYGDDLIVRSDCYETVCELLEAMGHVVNRRKSYGSGCFRESCGGWYYRGESVTPIFWPRRVVLQRDLAGVCCSLQHKFFGAFPCLQRLLEDEATGLVEGMTYSPYGEECDDLWSLEVLPLFSDQYRHWHSDEPGRKSTMTPLMEAVVYFEYLEYGPLYSSGLERLLGTSRSRKERFQ